MESNTALLHQPETPQQHPSPDLSPQNWKVIFIVLLIMNLFLINMYFGSLEINSIGDIVNPIVPLVLLGSIDFAVAAAFITSQHHKGGPKGKERIISYAVLIVGICALATAGIIIYTIVGLLKMTGKI
jgi:hypothetical protein